MKTLDVTFTCMNKNFDEKYSEHFIFHDYRDIKREVDIFHDNMPRGCTMVYDIAKNKGFDDEYALCICFHQAMKNMK